MTVKLIFFSHDKHSKNHHHKWGNRAKLERSRYCKTKRMTSVLLFMSTWGQGPLRPAWVLFTPTPSFPQESRVSLPFFLESDCEIRTIWDFQWQFGRDSELAHSFRTHCDGLPVHRAWQAKNSISSPLLAARAPRHALGPDKQISSFESCLWRSQMRTEAGLSHAFRVDCSQRSAILAPEAVLNVFLILHLSVCDPVLWRGLRSHSWKLSRQFVSLPYGLVLGHVTPFLCKLHSIINIFLLKLWIRWIFFSH